MKNRICLAWFCDLDPPAKGTKKARSINQRETPSRESAAPPERPQVKPADELRRTSGRR